MAQAIFSQRLGANKYTTLGVNEAVIVTVQGPPRVTEIRDIHLAMWQGDTVDWVEVVLRPGGDPTEDIGLMALRAFATFTTPGFFAIHAHDDVRIVVEPGELIVVKWGLSPVGIGAVPPAVGVIITGYIFLS
jgi:hypothetical protein